MKAAIITVAGIASRFNRELNRPTLKCIYNSSGDEKETLLYHIVNLVREMDKIVIVGGYLYEELQEYIDRNFAKIREKILLVKNMEYQEYGSGYSLFLGIQSLENCNITQIVFLEGDLFVKSSELNDMLKIDCDVVSANKELIIAEKSVVAYVNTNNQLKYIYDIMHGEVEILERFKLIFNSGQIWKFCNAPKLFQIMKYLDKSKITGTNLEIIIEYFKEIGWESIGLYIFEEWINCNTLKDYHKFLVSYRKEDQNGN